MTDDQEKQAPLDKLKARAFEKLKDELRANPEFQQMLYRMRPLDADAVVETAKELVDLTWPKVVSSGDDYIPVIDHPDERVRDLTLRLVVDRLLRERKPLPSLLSTWTARFLGVELLTGTDVEEIDPNYNIPEGLQDKSSGISESSICIWCLVDIGARSITAQQEELTVTRNDESSPELHETPQEFSVCDAVRDLLNEQGILNARGDPMTYDGVHRNWRRARKYLSGEA